MPRKASILVVDDEPHVLKLVKANLESSGYRVLTAEDGEHALQLVEKHGPDLVILDLMLPKMDGYAVCRRIREFSAVPVIMLTARSAQVDLVHGFEVGADDYLTKPFSVTELLMRVQAVLRRSKWPEEIMERLSFVAGPIEIDFAQHRVTVSGEAVKLTPTEYRLLAYLANNANRVILHRELLRAVWGPEYGEETEYLRVYIRYLRQKLEPEPAAPRYLLTQPGAGYMFYQPKEEGA
ncbi:MAG: response regulator transcription factor [Anaerolineae bacterium]|jgi:DNA-binding response OmpR family regulator|nr:response regulator transcription factor [Anaerolineae bacterium]MDX9831937.1 response regulator transcription factor [Anaerolineae bacterium]